MQRFVVDCITMTCKCQSRLRAVTLAAIVAAGAALHSQADIVSNCFKVVNYSPCWHVECTLEGFTNARALGFTGHKGAYELRKICIDHVYQKYGAEMAVSISGDDIRTITRYYADPSRPNIGTTRIIDLL